MSDGCSHKFVDGPNCLRCGVHVDELNRPPPPTERTLIGGPLTVDTKARLKARVSSRAYKLSVAEMARAAVKWRESQPDADLKWRTDNRVLVDGDLQDPFVQGYLAASPAAFDLLRAMNAAVVDGSLLQATFALQVLGWVGQRDSAAVAAGLFERKKDG